MKHTGRYCPVTSFDIDHEINAYCDKVKTQLREINNMATHHAKSIKKAMIETILEDL